jgi:hypothetical protein
MIASGGEILLIHVNEPDLVTGAGCSHDRIMSGPE